MSEANSFSESFKRTWVSMILPWDTEVAFPGGGEEIYDPRDYGCFVSRVGSLRNGSYGSIIM